MNPTDAISVLEQAANAVTCTPEQRREMFRAVDILRDYVANSNPVKKTP